MIFDIIVLVLFISLVVMGYKYGTSKEMLNLAKVFIPISIASAFSGEVGMLLTKIGLLRANDWAVLTFTGFLLLFLMLWALVRAGEHYFNHFDLHSRWFSNNRFTSLADRFFCSIINGFQAVFLLTFFSFLSTQMSFSPQNYKPYLMHHSLLFPSMDRVCRKIVTGQFVDNIINDPTGTTTFEVLVKTMINKETLTNISDEVHRSMIVRARDRLNDLLGPAEEERYSVIAQPADQ